MECWSFCILVWRAVGLLSRTSRDERYSYRDSPRRELNGTSPNPLLRKEGALCTPSYFIRMERAFRGCRLVRSASAASWQ